MKKFNSSFSVLAIVAMFTLAGPVIASAATSPSLGTAGSYSILAGSQVTNTGATTISGDVGISPGIGSPPHFTGFGTVTLGGTIHDADAVALTAQGDKNTAYGALTSQTCSTDYGAVTKELAGENLVPGVYCANSFHLSSGTLTLIGSASDIWIFKSASDLVITGGASAKVSFIGGGQSCNVWWRVVSTASLDANSSLVGNVLADTSITFAAGSSLNGRALARTGAVTLSSNSITAPTCTGSPPPPSSQAILHVIKVVVGGTATPSDFTLHIKKKYGTDVAGSPAPGTSAPGVSFTLSPGTYVVSEDPNASYVRSFSGDCGQNGSVTLSVGSDKTCTITNTFKSGGNSPPTTNVCADNTSVNNNHHRNQSTPKNKDVKKDKNRYR